MGLEYRGIAAALPIREWIAPDGETGFAQPAKDGIRLRRGGRKRAADGHAGRFSDILIRIYPSQKSWAVNCTREYSVSRVIDCNAATGGQFENVFCWAMCD